MRVLVLGGSGFIGWHVVQALVGAGHQVRVYGRSTGQTRLRHDRAEYLAGDLADTAALSQALLGCDAVYHLISTTVPATAERDPVGDVQGNLIGTLGLLAAMRQQGIGRLVYMSSGGTVYGIPQQVPIRETHPLAPIGSYGIVKTAIEGFIAREIRHGLVPVVLRTANAYGPQQSTIGVLGFINTLLHCLSLGKPFELMGDGSVIRDFLHVRDLARLCLQALTAERPVTVNAGSGRGHSLREVIDLAAEITGQRPELVLRPARGIDAPVSVLDIRLAGETFGWSPRIGLREGLTDTWTWVQSQVSRETGS